MSGLAQASAETGQERANIVIGEREPREAGENQSQSARPLATGFVDDHAKQRKQPDADDLANCIAALIERRVAGRGPDE